MSRAYDHYLFQRTIIYLFHLIFAMHGEPGEALLKDVESTELHGKLS